MHEWSCGLCAPPAHLRVELGLPGLPAGKPASAAVEFTQQYVDYLSTDRGLAENSLLVYAPFVRDFLAYRLAKAGSLALETSDAETIRAFLLNPIRPSLIGVCTA